MRERKNAFVCEGDRVGMCACVSCGQAEGPRCVGYCVHAWLQSGATPLYIAAQEGHVEVVQALLAAGANKNAVSLVRPCAHREPRHQPWPVQQRVWVLVVHRWVEGLHWLLIPSPGCPTRGGQASTAT